MLTMFSLCAERSLVPGALDVVLKALMQCEKQNPTAVREAINDALLFFCQSTHDVTHNILRSLLQYKADINCRRVAQLHFVFQLILLVNNIGRNKTGDSALHIAVYNGCVECVATLIKHGASVTHTNAKGETPMHRLKYCFFGKKRLCADDSK